MNGDTQAAQDSEMSKLIQRLAGVGEDSSAIASKLKQMLIRINGPELVTASSPPIEPDKPPLRPDSGLLGVIESKIGVINDKHQAILAMLTDLEVVH